MNNKFIELTVSKEAEGEQFSAFCHELGTASCGDTIDEALRNIREAIALHLSTLEELGELHRFLEERGIVVMEGRPTGHRHTLDLPPEVLGMKVLQPVARARSSPIARVSK